MPISLGAFPHLFLLALHPCCLSAFSVAAKSII